MATNPPQPTEGKHAVYLIGDPVGHSISPAIHNAAFQAQGMNLAYVAWRVEKGDVQLALTQLYESGAAGANVTVPHKQVVHDLVDDLSETTIATGAVNTLVRKSEGWCGENTDVEGFLGPLRRVKLDFEGGTVLILGAGGAARAVVVALLREYEFERIVVAARRVEQAEALCTAVQGRVVGTHGRASLQSCPLDSITDIENQLRPRLIVNATPVGMHPNDDNSPLPEAFDFQGIDVAYDLVYNPSETTFLRQARRAGVQTMNGLPMLLAQAAASFHMWTGQEMDLQAVKSALTESF